MTAPSPDTILAEARRRSLQEPTFHARVVMAEQIVAAAEGAEDDDLYAVAAVALVLADRSVPELSAICRHCDARVTPSRHPVLGSCWVDDNGRASCPSPLIAGHEPRLERTG